ncbi:unnamed protein product, partial [Symbiodinium pilosum]
RPGQIRPWDERLARGEDPGVARPGRQIFLPSQVQRRLRPAATATGTQVGGFEVPFETNEDFGEALRAAILSQSPVEARCVLARAYEHGLCVEMHLAVGQS